MLQWASRLSGSESSRPLGVAASWAVPFPSSNVVPACAARTRDALPTPGLGSTRLTMRMQDMPFKTGRSQDWTPERIGRLATPDLRQLRENAEKLGATS